MFPAVADFLTYLMFVKFPLDESLGSGGMDVFLAADIVACVPPTGT